MAVLFISLSLAAPGQTSQAPAQLLSLSPLAIYLPSTMWFRSPSNRQARLFLYFKLQRLLSACIQDEGWRPRLGLSGFSLSGPFYLCQGQSDSCAVTQDHSPHPMTLDWILPTLWTSQSLSSNIPPHCIFSNLFYRVTSI